MHPTTSHDFHFGIAGSVGLDAQAGMDVNSPVKFKHLVSMGASIGLVCSAALGQRPAVAAPATTPDLSEAVVEAEPIPPEVLASAVEAVNKLGKEVEMGRYRAAVERMNPLWKKRTADRMGGMKALEAQLDGVAAQMVQQGVTILSSKAEGQPVAYEVKPGTKIVKEDGTSIEKIRHTMWLVLVPTITRFRIFPPGAQRAMMIDSRSFQAALTEKNKIDWTFIDGANLNVSDLRGLFSTLPKDMVLPLVKKQESR